MSGGIIFGNKIIDIVFLSMMIAQMIKIFIPVLKGKKPEFSKLFETGGMPSSHSASVISLCTCIAIIYGTTSIYFAMTMVIATIVMYDATGIRREAGRHAKILNKIILSDLKLFKTKEFKEFKEFLGHTPLEVLGGMILGILVPYMFGWYLV
ncbi:divergent PAP2 family protein [Oceanivirga salmonicida]|uniref:divergent PAP2 family protein n=1 Tax=Oceanivirga salmonicida TaxID=1769291 RepID=UPI0012E2F2A3|nr:divergent PAP2 family protein [Oceanivirga salmonicida]